MRPLLDKLLAILRRDALTAIRYRSSFAVTLVGVLTELAAFYYLSRAIGPGFRPDGVPYFPFLLVGTGVYTFFLMSAQAFLNAVQQAQQAVSQATLIGVCERTVSIMRRRRVSISSRATATRWRGKAKARFCSMVTATVLCQPMRRKAWSSPRAM